ncbi:MAG: ribonuclease Z [Acidobacteria bacterium]|nr:ribonuclease Z [Acidobacteriota bacterium]
MRYHPAIMFRAVVLGSGASLPTLQRQTAAVAVQYEGDVYLFDCGEGTQLQWRRAALRFGRLRGIFISHLHGDHLNGLVGLLQTLSLGDRDEPLRLFGPPGIEAYWKAIQRYQGVRLGYPLEIVESEGGVLVEGRGHAIECALLDHGIRTLGFRLAEDERPGRFDPVEAERLGVAPGPDFGRLQSGEAVDGTSGTVLPEQVMGPARPGRSVAYTADTRACPAVVKLAHQTTLFLCDSTFGSELEREAAARGHCTAAQAARMAHEAGAERLVLTHISARYHDTRPLRAEAREIFKNTEVARDLMEYGL